MRRSVGEWTERAPNLRGGEDVKMLRKTPVALLAGKWLKAKRRAHTRTPAPGPRPAPRLHRHDTRDPSPPPHDTHGHGHGHAPRGPTRRELPGGGGADPARDARGGGAARFCALRSRSRVRLTARQFVSPYSVSASCLSPQAQPSCPSPWADGHGHDSCLSRAPRHGVSREPPRAGAHLSHVASPALSPVSRLA